ncbi:MAG: biotin/lipoyl-containing protein, partial [Pseudomonadota bacterium]
VSVTAAGEVTAGDTLFVLEAMKMEHTLKAPRAGRIAALHVTEGDQVEDGSVLLELEPEDG